MRAISKRTFYTRIGFIFYFYVYLYYISQRRKNIYGVRHKIYRRVSILYYGILGDTYFTLATSTLPFRYTQINSENP